MKNKKEIELKQYRDRRKAIFYLFLVGVPSSDIAKIFHISKTRFYQIIKEEDYKMFMLTNKIIKTELKKDIS